MIQIAQDRGYVVEETDLIRTDLYLADEVFMTGTAAEVTPVRAVDDVEVGVGPVTLELQGAYLDVVNGRSDAVEPLARRGRGRDEVRRDGLARGSRARCPASAGHRARPGREHAGDDAVLLLLGQRRPARQAEPALEEPRGHVAAEGRVRRVDRLEVHRLPERPGLDVLGLEREPDRLAVGAERVRRRRGCTSARRCPRRTRASGMNAMPGHAVEERPVAVADPAPRCDALRQRLELRAPERGEQVAHPVVEADLEVLVVGDRLARLGRELPRVLDELGVRRRRASRRRSS